MVWKDNHSRDPCSVRLLLMDPSRNFENRLRAETDPALAVAGEVPRLIDEWQEVPKLWDAARFECDNRGGEPGQFIFTGRRRRETMNGRCTVALEGSLNCAWIP